MAQLKPTSRMYSGVKPLSAMYQGSRKMWEPPVVAPPPTPPTLAGTATVFGTGSLARTLTFHAGVATGDLLIHIVAGTGSALWTTPAGFSVWKADVITGSLITTVHAKVRAAGETTYTTTPSGTTSSSHLLLNVRGWSGSLGAVVVGADGTRAASGGTVNTTAPTITAAISALVLAISTERTTAVDTVAPTANNGFTQVAYAPAPDIGTQIEQVWVGGKTMSAAGAVGATTVTYQNTQASNSLAFLVAIGP